MIALSRFMVSEARTVLPPRTRVKAAGCRPFGDFPDPIVSSARPNRRCAARDSACLPTSRCSARAVFPAIARGSYTLDPPDQRFPPATRCPCAWSPDPRSGSPGRPSWPARSHGPGKRAACSVFHGPAAGTRRGRGEGPPAEASRWPMPRDYGPLARVWVWGSGICSSVVRGSGGGRGLVGARRWRLAAGESPGARRRGGGRGGGREGRRARGEPGGAAMWDRTADVGVVTRATRWSTVRDTRWVPHVGQCTEHLFCSQT